MRPYWVSIILLIIILGCGPGQIQQLYSKDEFQMPLNGSYSILIETQTGDTLYSSRISRKHAILSKKTKWSGVYIEYWEGKKFFQTYVDENYFNGIYSYFDLKDSSKVTESGTYLNGRRIIVY